MSNCALCQKLDDLDSQPSDEVLWKFPNSVALLGPWQYYHGYCLLVSCSHAKELSELNDETRHAFLAEMCILARAIEECFRPNKMNYELLGNQVNHLHWHLFPRYRSDPDSLQPVWLALAKTDQDASERERLQTGPADRAATAQRLREKLKELA